MKTVIVLGIRSGTSLVAGLLFDMGIYMGKNFRGPDDFNAKGYYEENEILTCIERVVFDGGRFQQNGPVMNLELERLKQLKEVLDNHKREPIWGFKAPGATFALRAIELFVEDPHYILCVRDRVEVAKSLETQKNHIQPTNFKLGNWIDRFFHTMKQETSGKKNLVVDYNEMLQDPEEHIRKIGKFLGISLTEKDVDRLSKRVDPTLKHHVHDKPQYKGITFLVE